MISAGRLVRGALWCAGKACLSLAEQIPLSNGCVQPEILEREGEWIVCRIDGIVWRLNPSQAVDSDLLDDGIFEPDSTRWVDRLVRPGMIVADVGANIGYYTMRMSRLVGDHGHVHAFEPSARYRERLLDHLSRNGCKNVSVMDFGLSDGDHPDVLYGDETSSSIHWVNDGRPPPVEEAIKLTTFDSYAAAANLTRLDFVKIDIDGHEPRFLAGATETLRRFRPIILIEFAQLNLVTAGSDVEQLAEQLRDLGYELYSERTGELYSSRMNFLVDVMNCAFSANVVCWSGPAHENLDTLSTTSEEAPTVAGGVG